MEVDERRKILTISTPIKFARRAPPDTSAELEDSDKKDSISSIKDLATALKTYMARIIIEGHTGASNPADYWSALAKNRAELICSILLKNGVDPTMVELVRRRGRGSKSLDISSRQTLEPAGAASFFTRHSFSQIPFLIE